MSPSDIDNQTLAAAISVALKPHIGPAGRVPYDEASQILGIEIRTLQSWVQGQTPPQSHKLIRLFRWLGPEFTNEIIGLAGLFSLPVEPPNGDEHALNMRASELCFEMACAFLDGHVDHRERARLVKVAKTLLPLLGGYITAHEENVLPVAAE